LALKSDATTAEAMRAFPRFGVANAIKATQPDRPGEYQGTTLNLSIGGALLAMPVEIEAGSHLDFTLSLDGVNPVTLGGKVVYRKKLKDSVGTVYYHTGVEFGEEVKQHHEALTAFIGG
ncbi:MAG: PilZ domain-containing protein, partial [Nitrospinae bacterium]|nr:PilZ domain-containing protein [Nitrospinota bacterium]